MKATKKEIPAVIYEDGERWVSFQSIATLHGVEIRTITTWIRGNHIPIKRNQKYIEGSIVTPLLKPLVDFKRRSDGQGTTVDYQEQRARGEKNKNDLFEALVVRKTDVAIELQAGLTILRQSITNAIGRIDWLTKAKKNTILKILGIAFDQTAKALDARLGDHKGH